MKIGRAIALYTAFSTPTEQAEPAEPAEPAGQTEPAEPTEPTDETDDTDETDETDESRMKTLQRTDYVRRHFGYPDEETMSRLLEHDSHQQSDPVNNYDESSCPNCLNPMSSTHTCDDDFNIYE